MGYGTGASEMFVALYATNTIPKLGCDLIYERMTRIYIVFALALSVFLLVRANLSTRTCADMRITFTLSRALNF